MLIRSGRLVSLGHGKFARSDDVLAIEPITDGRGPGRRSMVWVRGLPNPLVASRSQEAIVSDLVTPESGVLRQQRTVLRNVVRSLDDVPPFLRRVLREENGVDLDALVNDANRILA